MVWRSVALRIIVMVQGRWVSGDGLARAVRMGGGGGGGGGGVGGGGSTGGLGCG